VRELANKTGMDFSEQIKELEEKYDQVRRDLYLGLTAVQRLSVARHPHRPTFLDHVLNITDKVGAIYSMCDNSCFTYTSAFLFFSHVTVDAN
jgi:acetyl-CoA carboxylase alpha subunit